VEIVCEGASWICRRDGEQHRWKRDTPCPPPDQGLPIDGAIRCGLNAQPDNRGGCSCDQGYLNQDGDWKNGCELPDPACSVVDCSKCPKVFCGQNAECRTIFSTHKCRCKDGFWLNTDGDWSNGCEVYTSKCAPNNCNSCYTGYCGPNANCMKNNCKCTSSGWYDCDKVWEISGCECKGGCNGSACK
jgi:hypothetical protein